MPVGLGVLDAEDGGRVEDDGGEGGRVEDGGRDDSGGAEDCGSVTAVDVEPADVDPPGLPGG